MSRQQAKPYHRTQAYVEGNTVRKLNTVPQREPREVREREQNKRIDRATRANRQRATQISAGYLFFLTMAVIVTVGVCACYVHLQAQVNTNMRNIASLESQILDLKTDNDAALKRIETSVNLEEVKNTAMTQLGMVYPTQEQIIYFEVDSQDYMNQYQNIPEK